MHQSIIPHSRIHSRTSQEIDPETCLCGRRVDIGAEESLSQDGKNAALRLLSSSRADVDEVIDAGWGGWCCIILACWTIIRTEAGKERTGSAVQVSEVEDISSATLW
jgi:hypothetical protein